jgi:hypothetical protein
MPESDVPAFEWVGQNSGLLVLPESKSSLLARRATNRPDERTALLHHGVSFNSIQRIQSRRPPLFANE